MSFKKMVSGLPISKFRPIILMLFRDYQWSKLSTDISAGLTVGIVALPLAMAFAIAAGLPPQTGIYTAIFAGSLIAIFGGCRVQIGGTTNVVVVVYSIIETYGPYNFLLATFISGFILFFMGLFKIGSFIRFIPVPTIIGFTNGIAILIILSQVKDFLGLTVTKMPAEFFSQLKTLYAALDTCNFYTIGLGVASLAILFLWPRTISASMPTWKKCLARCPSTIIVLIFATCLVSFYNLPVETIGTRFGGIPQSLPSFTMLDFSQTSIGELIRPALILAFLCSIESLLCARVADTLLNDRHDPNQELMGQGIANCFIPFLGGMPGTGTIARTVTNVKSGGISPIAGLVHAATLLAIILVAAPLAKDIPLCALAAILLFMAYNMMNLREFIRLRQFTMGYRATLLATFFLTIIFDLTVAVEVGLAIASLFFMYHMNTLTRVTQSTNPNIPKGIQVWNLQGALFFGSVSKLENLTDPRHVVSPDAPDVIVLNFTSLLSLDNSAGTIIENLNTNLINQGKVLIIAGATDTPLVKLKRLMLDRRLGKYLAKDMEEAMALAKEAQAQIQAKREQTQVATA